MPATGKQYSAQDLLNRLTNAGGTAHNVELTGSRATGTLHRSAITATDKLAVITITAADSATAGSLTAVSHGIGVAPGNIYGTVGMSALVTVTPTVNKSIDITIPQCAGATYYDICLSTAPTAPLWVARVTEAQRAAGCAVTAVGTVGAGGSAGVVNVQVVGTGIASTNAVFAQNNAYTPATPTAVNCTGVMKVRVLVKVALTDLRAAPSLNLIPFMQNKTDTTIWHQGTITPVLLVAGIGQSFYQEFEMYVDGTPGLVILISSVVGQGAAVSIWVDPITGR